jgi:RinA family phage transcriptional activator
MDKKKAINIIEHHLRSYKTYEIGIKNLKKSLDDILPAITTNYTLREGTNGSFDITSKVEMAVLDRLEGSKAIYLTEQIRELQTVVESINEALSALGDTDRDFIKFRYIDGYSIEKTAQTINMSVQNCFKIRNHVMDNLLISLRNIVKVSVEIL